MSNSLDNLPKIKNEITITSTIFYEVYLNMLKAQDKNSKSIDLSNFLHYFGNLHQTYIGYIQHDVQEILRFLLGYINKELNKIIIDEEYKEINFRNI